MTVTIPILSPILAFVILMEPRSHPFHQLAAVGLVVVNLMWFVKFMTRYAAGWTAGAGKDVKDAAPTVPASTKTGAAPSSPRANGSPRKRQSTVAA